ncbi:MAG: RNA polymerase sigma factor [Bryobacteraceae bacterium]|nr:RNA polymerase sigma factor [Bryobacteraceae bacterium]MDW8377405.1 RNA polymerase sigma factor [Bryobacterales bacterium]
MSGEGQAIPVLAQVEVPSSAEEGELIRAAQKGDAAAFEALVQAYDQAVLRLAFNLLRNEEDAFDVYQETFLRVHRNIRNFRFDCSFRSWLFRIVTNLCLDWLRKRKVRKEEPVCLETEDGLVDRTSSLPADHPASDPQRKLTSQELGERIDRALSQLTPRERMVFELRHFHGMRLRAIGEILGASEEATKNCLFRATQKMRAALGDFR